MKEEIEITVALDQKSRHIVEFCRMKVKVMPRV